MKAQLDNERIGVRPGGQESEAPNSPDAADVNPLLRSFDEPTRIRFVREGFYFGPRVWRGVPTEDRRPFNLPPEFNLDELEDPELKLIVELGIVTVAILTNDQRARWRESGNLEITRGTAASLLGKLRSGSTASKPDPED